MSKPRYQTVDDGGLAAVAKQMRKYAVEHPILDYDAFAAEAKKPMEGVIQEQVNDEIHRSRGRVVPVMEPYTRFVCYRSSHLQLLYMHILDPKVQPMRQLNVVDNWGFPLSMMLCEDGLTHLLEQFVELDQPAEFKDTPPHVIMAFQPLPRPGQHEQNYPKR